MDAVNWIEKIPGVIAGIAEGGTVGTILKLVLTLALIVGGLMLKAWIEKVKREAAAKETAVGRAKDQGSIVDENQKTEADGKKAEGEIRDIFKKKP